ncbi:MAG: prepilin peptidase [Myxococcota bacterium]
MDPYEVIQALWLAFGAVVGACMGSFANVVIARMPRDESIVHPPSHCPNCKTPIKPWQNIPIASWLALRGRARCCGTPISPRYVVVELLGALGGFSVVLIHRPNVMAVFYGLMLWLLMCVAIIDWKHWFIPRALSLSLVVLGFVGNAVGAWWSGVPLQSAVTAASIMSGMGTVVGFTVVAVLLLGFTWLYRATGRLGADEEAMGWGDAQLLAGIGACLGVNALPWVLGLASLSGTVIGGWVTLEYRMRVRRGEVAETVPEPTGNPDDDEWRPPEGSVQFGPFLALGAAMHVLMSSFLPDVDVTVIFRGLWEG